MKQPSVNVESVSPRLLLVIALALVAGCAERLGTPGHTDPQSPATPLVLIKRTDGYCLAVKALNFEQAYTRRVALAVCNAKDPAQQWHYRDDKQIVSEITDTQGLALVLEGQNIDGARPIVWARSQPAHVQPYQRWDYDAQRNNLSSQSPNHAGKVLTVAVSDSFSWLDPRGSGRQTQRFVIVPIPRPAPLVQLKGQDGFCLAVGEPDFGQSYYVRHVGLVACNAKDPAQQWRHAGDKAMVSQVVESNGGQLLLEGQETQGPRPAVWVRLRSSELQANQRWEYNARRRSLFTQSQNHDEKALTAFKDDRGRAWLDPWNGTPMQQFMEVPLAADAP